ncbi:dCMP deaminase [Vibrio phage K469]
MSSLILSPETVSAYLKAAQAMATRSVAERLKVGCVIVSATGDLLSAGFNHMPSFMDECCENADGTSSKFVVHAEHDAIRKCPDRSKLMGAVAIVTHQPCDMCAEKLASAGIGTVFYEEPYRLTDGLTLLMSTPVNVYQKVGEGFFQIHGVFGGEVEASLVDSLPSDEAVERTQENTNGYWRNITDNDTVTVWVSRQGDYVHTNPNDPDYLILNVDVINPNLCNNTVGSQIHNAISGLQHTGELDRMFDFNKL